jgi:DNA-binding NtrC family response regulator
VKNPLARLIAPLRPAPDTSSSGRMGAGIASVPILLVLSERQARTQLDRLLTGSRYVPVPVSDLNQASRLLNQVVFPIILCDLTFAETGRQTCVKQLLVGWHRPAIILVSTNLSGGTDSATVCGAVSDILPEPLDRMTLLSSLDQAHRKWWAGSKAERQVCAACQGL